MRAALQLGSTSPEVVAVEARRATKATAPAEVSAAVLPLPGLVPPAVSEPAVERALPSVQAYDQLLTRRPTTPTIDTQDATKQGEAV
jgi:hypothetical protein